MISTEPGRIIETDPSTDPRWERFVLGHPDSSIYHHPAWLRVLHAENDDSRPAHMACEGPDGRFIAIMPMLYTRGAPAKLGGTLGSRRLSSLPRTPVAGPLSEDRGATAALLRAAISRLGEGGGTQLQIKAHRCDLAGLVDNLAPVRWRDSYILQLPTAGPFRLSDSAERARVKWAINKATRLGVRVRPADTEADLLQWYMLYLETMRRNAVPPRSLRFFTGLWTFLRPQGLMELLLAEQEEAGRVRMIAGSIFLRFRRTVSYVFNGSRRADFALRPNDVIQWKAINDACNSGFQYFDFGEVPDGNRDLAKFKRKWGATAVGLHRFYYPTVSPPGCDHSKLHEYAAKAGRALWCRVPLRATAWIGDRLYRYL